MANCAIVGINWGDEGKGRMVDYLTGQYDVLLSTIWASSPCTCCPPAFSAAV